MMPNTQQGQFNQTQYAPQQVQSQHPQGNPVYQGTQSSGNPAQQQQFQQPQQARVQPPQHNQAPQHQAMNSYGNGQQQNGNFSVYPQQAQQGAPTQMQGQYQQVPMGQNPAMMQNDPSVAENIKKTKTFSLVSLISGICGVALGAILTFTNSPMWTLFITLALGIVALVFGIMSSSKAKKVPFPTKKGKSIAGIILGICAIVLSAFIMIAAFAVVLFF